MITPDGKYLPTKPRHERMTTRYSRATPAEGAAHLAVFFTYAFASMISFQAPDFYRKHGYETFGEVPCEPEGAARVFMVKVL
ncbi:hypothetical protein [Burkholderia arboris]|uniref:hypothetical protein n=1 Tax=Burkholderia arboris TaxID=488730 RepID=UPI0039A71675